MTKVTGKFQITVPKRLVNAYGIEVGDEVELSAAGAAIAIMPARTAKTVVNVSERLRHFDIATRRNSVREHGRSPALGSKRGWTREDLHTRGRAR